MTEIQPDRLGGIVPGHTDQITEAGHVARYQWAGAHAASRRVLDVGSGAGYGAAMLAERARFVAALDPMPEAAYFARERYARERLAFVVGDGCAIPFADGSFELAVSFAVIEHVREQEAFVREVARILKDDGLFIISTPNRLTEDQLGRIPGAEIYHGHIARLAPKEFKTLLQGAFRDVDVQGTRRKGRPIYNFLRKLDVLNLRLRLLPWRWRKSLLRMGGLERDRGTPEEYCVERAQLRQSQHLMAFCSGPRRTS